MSMAPAIKTLGLVACSKSKSQFGQRAQTIYKGALFIKSLAVAKKQCDAVAILSARHGLLPLDKFIQPYDETLHAMRNDLRQAWAAQVADRIAELFPKHQIIYYAGSIYCSGLPKGEQPMKGMTIGKRLQWLDNQLKGRTLI